MKKKILTLVAMATLVTMMTACGTSETKDASTTPSTTPVVTVEPTEVPEVTVEPTVEPTEVPEVTVEPTVEPTEVPEVTVEPTVEPTEIPEVTPTETPVEPEVTVEPTEAPTQAPTKAPEVTVEPTETPAEPTEAPSVNVAEDPNFEVIKNMVVEMMTVDYTNYKYEEFATIIETMDKSRYEVTAVDSLDPILKDGLSDDEKKTAVENFLGLVEFEKYRVKVEGKNSYKSYAAAPTGEFYVMTLTDNVTGETIAWGLRVHLEATDNPGTYYVKEWGPEGFIQAGSVAEVPVADFYKIAE